MVEKPDIMTLFNEALSKATFDERGKFLDDACGQDDHLRMRLGDLLRAHVDAGGFLGGTDATWEPLGTTIGPYTLLEQIGEGGFGVVFLAEQATPIRRRVALKIVKPGMDTRQVLARFEAERQALALMDHPGIAKVFDAGVTEQGRPYFVMELVQGVPINEYCDECQLPTRERLSLFISVCQAVQHAHQKGIIHRDLKPTNVLVAMQDGKPVPKIIDFGIAKAIEQRLTEHTLTTAFAQMIGTPMYMSPEQAELSPLGVDTRTDIYALGVLLYELLTGTTPLDRDQLHAAGYDEMRRIIREQEPLRPSARISTMKAHLATTVAEHRRTVPRRLRQSIEGDLDWIVLKCLEKDRNRRYDSTGSLASDIERYLNDEPVQACPPSAAYRLKKFVRRNRVSILVSSAIVLALALGLALATMGLLQARREAIRADREAGAARSQTRVAAAEAAKAAAISELLQTALQSANPEQSNGSEYTVRQLLDDFSGGLSDQLARQPEVEADIRATIGNAYRRIGRFDLSASQFEAALKLRRRLGHANDADYAELLVDYAQNLAEYQRFDDAERTAREAIGIYRRVGVTGRPLVKALWILQLQLADRLEKATEASDLASACAEEQDLVDEALAISREDGTEYPELANILHRHAPIVSKLGDQARAEEWARRAVEMHRRVHGNDHLETAFGLADLGRVLRYQSKFREAESAFNEAIQIFRRYFREGHSTIQSVQLELKSAMENQNTANFQNAAKDFSFLWADWIGAENSRLKAAKAQGIQEAESGPPAGQEAAVYVPTAEPTETKTNE